MTVIIISSILSRFAIMTLTTCTSKLNNKIYPSQQSHNIMLHLWWGSEFMVDVIAGVLGFIYAIFLDRVRFEDFRSIMKNTILNRLLIQYRPFLQSLNPYWSIFIFSNSSVLAHSRSLWILERKQKGRFKKSEKRAYDKKANDKKSPFDMLPENQELL